VFCDKLVTRHGQHEVLTERQHIKSFDAYQVNFSDDADGRCAASNPLQIANVPTDNGHVIAV